MKPVLITNTSAVHKVEIYVHTYVGTYVRPFVRPLVCSFLFRLHHQPAERASQQQGLDTLRTSELRTVSVVFEGYTLVAVTPPKE